MDGIPRIYTRKMNLKRILNFSFLMVLLLEFYSCSNNQEVTAYSILDSSQIVNGKQYLVNCSDSDWLSMYSFGYKKLETESNSSVIGFFFNVPDSLKFKPNGAIPDGYAKKTIGIMQYDSAYNNYTLRKISW